LDGYKAQQKALKAQEKTFKDYKYKNAIDTVMALQIDIDQVKTDEVKKVQRLDWVKRYMKDAQLDESIQILYDWTKK